ncbi:unnamed protein product [Eruca vesicaria subsp. sativa]|uniref:No apical meristem-associated C-terminal domain-containing protein n=1 Tax=Eruca vesicaria subsp. sativa TaxID=29727 RepID=A0ABC8L9Q1_ERUVS|nr:unnamed protein product [Eruca vesicaria subsp. sativa]
MERAKKLLVQDPKLKKGFKFDHVWFLMKDILKFTDNVNIGIHDTPNTEKNISGYPTSQSPGLSSFSINLSSDDGGSNSSQCPIGSKKAKIAEGNSSYVDNLVSLNEKLLDILQESASSREKGFEIAQLRAQNQAKKLALQEIHEENKMLLTNLDSIVDFTTREFIRSQQERIIKKRTQEQQQQPSVAPVYYGNYFGVKRGQNPKTNPSSPRVLSGSDSRVLSVVFSRACLTANPSSFLLPLSSFLLPPSSFRLPPSSFWLPLSSAVKRYREKAYEAFITD